MQHKQTQTQNENQTIFDLIKTNDVNGIKQKLSTLTDPTLKDYDPKSISDYINATDPLIKSSALTHAILAGNKEIVALLINAGADISIGGLRTRKTVLDIAKAYPEIASLVYPPTKKYFDEAKASNFKGKSEIEKAKLALIAFSIAEYTENNEECKAYHEDAKKLLEEISRSTTVKKDTLLQLEGPLFWRQFQHYLYFQQNNQLACQYLGHALKRYLAIAEKTDNLVFEREMLLETISRIADLDPKSYLAMKPIMGPLVSSLFARLFELIWKGNDETIEYFLNEIFNLFIKQDKKLTRTHQEIAAILYLRLEDALKKDQNHTKNPAIYASLANNYQAISLAIASSGQGIIEKDEKGYLTDTLCSAFFAKSSAWSEVTLSKISQQEKTTQENLTLKLKVIKAQNGKYIEEITKIHEIYKHNISLTESWFKSNDYESLLRFLKEKNAEKQSETKVSAKLSSGLFPFIPFHPIHPMVVSYLKINASVRPYKFFIGNVELNKMVDKKTLNNFVENLKLFMQIAISNNRKDDFYSLRDRLCLYFREIADYEIKSISERELTQIKITLLTMIKDCEKKILSLMPKIRPDMTEEEKVKLETEYQKFEINSLNALNHYVAQGVDKLNKMDVSSLAETKGKLFYSEILPIYEDILPQIIDSPFKNQLSSYTFTNVVAAYQAAEITPQNEAEIRKKMIEYSKKSILLEIKGIKKLIQDGKTIDETTPDTLVHRLSINVSMIAPHNTYLFEEGSSVKYGLNEAQDLGILLHCLVQSMRYLKKTKCTTQTKENSYAKIITFILREATRLAESDLYFDAIKFILIANKEIVSLSKNTELKRQYIDENFNKIQDMLFKMVLKLKTQEAHLIDLHQSVNSIIDVVKKCHQGAHFKNRDIIIKLVLDHLHLFGKEQAHLLESLYRITGENASREDIKTYPIIAELNFAYLASLNQYSFDSMKPKNIAQIEELLQSCQMDFAERETLPNNYYQVLIDLTSKVSSWHQKQKVDSFHDKTTKLFNAIELQNQIIDLCELSNMDARPHIYAANQLISQLILMLREKGQLNEAILLYSTMISNCEMLEDHKFKADCIIERVKLCLALSEDMKQHHKYHGLIGFYKELLTHLNEALTLVDTPKEVEFLMNTVIEAKLEAETLFIAQVNAQISLIEQELNDSHFVKASTLCEQLQKKLSDVEFEHEPQELFSELSTLAKRSNQGISFVAAGIGQNVDREEKKPTTQETGEKKKKKKKKGSGGGGGGGGGGSSAKTDKTKETEEKIESTENPIEANLPAEYRNRPHRIGQRINGQHVHANDNTYPVFMKDAKKIAELRKDKILYRSLKQVILNGYMCRAQGENGIKYLGLFGKSHEAKVVSSISRINGVVVNGANDTKFIVFDEYASRGTHKSK